MRTIRRYAVLAALAVAFLAVPGAFGTGLASISSVTDLTISSPENTMTVTATWTLPTATDDNGDPTPVTCTPSSGSSSFPVGTAGSPATTPVTCTASDGIGGTLSTSFDVVAEDTTVPVVTVSAPPQTNVPDYTNPVAVTYATPSADDGASPICSPASGSPSFALGTTVVSCSATDGAGNVGTASFSVVVADNTPPFVTVPADITVSVDQAAFKAVTYSASAVDGSTPVGVNCSPASGASFPLGTTTVTCTATDAAGNPASASFTVTVQDTTPPSVSITSAPSGTANSSSASIAFTASDGTTMCQLDGGGFSGCSSPVAYTGLADGSHTVVVHATDAAGNTGSDSVSWSIDATPPAISAPSTIVVEADSPGGGNVIYSVTASDRGSALPPSAISCSPPSGAKVPLGKSKIACSATDSAGNVALTTIAVVVRDTTPPAINAPDVSVTATGPAGIRKTDPPLARYLGGVSATDLVSTPTLTNDAPDQLPIGKTVVTFTAVDAAGNTTTKRATVTVLQPGTQAPPPDLTPPADPTGVTATPGDGTVTLAWHIASDVAYTTVTVDVPETGSTRTAYRGPLHAVTVRGLRNGTSYRFVLVAWDRAGNRSKGIVVRATPKAEILTSPGSKARVTSPPMLRWKHVRDAAYFNVQVWRGSTKLLSAWPVASHYQLARTWVYEGKKHTLLPGTYTWYVWPGIGPRAEAKYGQLLGSRSFVLVGKGPAV